MSTNKVAFNVTLKRFFKERFNIPVLVHTGSSQNPYISARIKLEKIEKHTDPLRYLHAFPATLTCKCMGIVYKGHPGLCEQATGGNIDSHSISMHSYEWLQLLNDPDYNQ